MAISSSSNQKTVRIDIELKATCDKTKSNNTTFFDKMKKIVNRSFSVRELFHEKTACNNDIDRAKSFYNNINAKVIDSKVVRDFISQKLTDLKITLTADEDHTYARQTCDAILASVYSNKKDYFCKEMISRGIDISGFIKEAGNAAQKAGLAGQKNNHDVFIPSGAGANPFVTSVISSAQQKFPRVFLNKNQQASFKQYAEKKISSEVGEICKKLGLITPVDFGLVLDEIASRYISL